MSNKSGLLEAIPELSIQPTLVSEIGEVVGRFGNELEAVIRIGKSIESSRKAGTALIDFETDEEIKNQQAFDFLKELCLTSRNAWSYIFDYALLNWDSESPVWTYAESFQGSMNKARPWIELTVSHLNSFGDIPLSEEDEELARLATEYEINMAMRTACVNTLIRDGVDEVYKFLITCTRVPAARRFWFDGAASFLIDASFSWLDKSLLFLSSEVYLEKGPFDDLKYHLRSLTRFSDYLKIVVEATRKEKLSLDPHMAIFLRRLQSHLGTVESILSEFSTAASAVSSACSTNIEASAKQALHEHQKRLLDLRQNVVPSIDAIPRRKAISVGKLGKLRVVLYQSLNENPSESGWHAHCLEYNYVSFAPSKENALARIQSMMTQLFNDSKDNGEWLAAPASSLVFQEYDRGTKEPVSKVNGLIYEVRVSN